MIGLPADFHFLRPDWLFALIPGLLLALLAWRRLGHGREDWRGLVDAHLLRHLSVRDKGAARRWPVAALIAGWCLAAVAAAGPTWEKVPTPALDELDPTVIVLSLAQGMNATDQNPDRLTAARHKAEDVLTRMRGGQVALIVYADAPFVAAPLTEDGRVIAQMLPELATDLMPVLNDRPDLAIRQAADLLRNTGAKTGRILLATNGPGDAPDLTRAAARAAYAAGYEVSILGVGAEQPLPMTGPQGQALRAPNGAALTTRLDVPALEAVAAAGGGRFTRVTADGTDLDALLARAAAGRDKVLQASGLTADQWVDKGPFLVLVLVLLASLAFRRGWLAALPFALTLALAAPEARAQDEPSGMAWRDLWQTPDQQGASAFAAQDYSAAAGAFRNPAWAASALYKAGNYAQAASAFAGQPGADFNRGNALARAGKLQDAVAAYDAALAADPNDADAAFNRDLVLKLLQQQQNQQDQQKQEQDKNQKPQDQQGDQASAQNQKSPSGKDQKPDDQKPQQSKPDQGKQEQAKQEQAKQEQAKQEQAKQEQAKQEQAKQEQAKQEQARQEQARQDQARQEQAKQQQANPQQAKPEPTDQKPDPSAPPAQALRPMTEQDQNREQTLRMVPNDPTGLLRARIRAHYTGITVPTVEEP